MDTILHGKIGKLLAEELINKGYTEINKGKFVWGCIMPDIVLSYRISFHTKKENMEDVKEIISMIIDNNNNLIENNISIKLGVMVHYLCDFFTYTHNENYNRNLICHELYEQVQHIKYSNKLKNLWESLNEEVDYRLYDIKDIINYIEDIHSIYMNNNSNKYRDLIFAIINIRVVLNSIMDLRKSNIYGYESNKILVVNE